MTDANAHLFFVACILQHTVMVSSSCQLNLLLYHYLHHTPHTTTGCAEPIPSHHVIMTASHHPLAWAECFNLSGKGTLGSTRWTLADLGANSGAHWQYLTLFRSVSQFWLRHCWFHPSQLLLLTPVPTLGAGQHALSLTATSPTLPLLLTTIYPVDILNQICIFHTHLLCWWKG